MNETPSLPALSVIVPCLNEAEGLLAFYARMKAACRGVVEDSYEILFVNDGSTDETLNVLSGLAEQDSHIVIVNLSRNYGHQIALTAGLSLCAGQRALIIDADLQDPPELLPFFMKALDEGADIAFGQRLRRHGEGWFKRASASFFYRLLGKLADTAMPLDAGDFRLISRRAINLVNAMPERSRFLRGMMGWIGLKQVVVPYERTPRLSGKTKFPFRKMLGFALDGITSFSIVPLRLASYIGAAFGFAGLALLVYVLRSWFLGEVVQGWTSLMVVVLVIGSAQLICLGVFGEYLGRLYMESKQRPLFVVESVRRGGSNTGV